MVSTALVVWSLGVGSAAASDAMDPSESGLSPEPTASPDSATSSDVPKKFEAIDICLNGECGPAKGRFTRDQLIGGLLALLKANENTEATLCDSDPKTNECVRDGISFFVQGGPIPGVANYGNLYLTHVGLDKKTYQIKYTMAAGVTWVGTPVLCQDQYTEITVRSVNEILIESPSFACTWTIIPHVWSAQYSVESIDFDNSVITGYYDIGGAGLFVGGGGSGPFRMTFAKKNTLDAGGVPSKTAGLTPVGALPVQVLAAPVPTPEDVATSTGEFDLEERRLWEAASEKGESAGFKEYLEKYPEGRFAGAARSKLQAAEATEAQNREIEAWSAIKDSTDPAAFETYLEKYPDGLFADVATARVRRLKAAAADAAALDAELALWEKVKTSTVVGEIETYLNRYPEGQFAELAKTRIEKLRGASTKTADVEMSLWNNIKNSRDIRDYQGFLQAFPNGIFAEVAKGRIQSLNEIEEQTAELRFWNDIKASKNPDDFNAYLRRYPDGQFAGLARQLVDQFQRLEREKAELALWAEARDSRDPKKFAAYLARFPDGRFAAEARARKVAAERELAFGNVDFGRYHALVIGIDDYQYLPKLETAVNDARGIARVLKETYGFKVTLLENPRRLQIIDALDRLRETLEYQDNLVIYYAGHGWLDEEAARGYWQPADAKPNRRGNWISNTTLTDTLRTLAAKHVMVVADSCFSGTLVRGADSGFADAEYGTAKYWRRISDKMARVAITSGGLEPVVDKGGSGHSPFAKAFISALDANPGVMDGTSLFNAIRRPVAIAAQQTPEYSDVRDAGHDGGDFLFVRRK